MPPEAEELNLEEERGLANCLTELVEGLRLSFVWIVGAHHRNTQEGDFVWRVESVTEMHRATFLFIFSYLKKNCPFGDTLTAIVLQCTLWRFPETKQLPL